MRRAPTRLRAYLAAACLAVVCLAALILGGRALGSAYHSHGQTIHYGRVR